MPLHYLWVCVLGFSVSCDFGGVGPVLYEDNRNRKGRLRVLLSMLTVQVGGL